MARPSPTKVLLVDHDDDIRRLARLSLERDGRFVVVADVFDLESAGRAVLDEMPDVVVLDLDLRGRTSLDPLVRLRELAPTAMVVSVAAESTDELRTRVSMLGGAGLLERADVLAVAPILAHVCGLRRRSRVGLVGGATLAEGGLDSTHRTSSP